MHAWCHPGKANLHCMLLKYLHMYTTGIKKSSRHTVLKTADTLTKAYKKQLRKKSRLSSAMFFLLPSNGLQLQYFFFCLRTYVFLLHSWLLHSIILLVKIPRMCETEIFFANSLLRIVKFEISHADANAKNSHLFAKYAKNSHLFAKLYIFVYNWVIFVYNFVLYRNNFAN